MQDSNAAKLLARVMGWQDQDSVLEHVAELQLLAYYKYDHYQRFGPGRRFIESLALWLKQFDPTDRPAAHARRLPPQPARPPAPATGPAR